MLRALLYELYGRQLERSIRRGALPRHFGVILDGNRRYARRMGLAQVAEGHLRGADIEGFAAAAGILTATGGRTSHAAVVARQMAKVCLVGCAALDVDLESRTCTIGGRRFAEGDVLTLDGDAGLVYDGMARILTSAPAADLAALEGLRALVPV